MKVSGRVSIKRVVLKGIAHGTDLKGDRRGWRRTKERLVEKASFIIHTTIMKIVPFAINKGAKIIRRGAYIAGTECMNTEKSSSIFPSICC
jgi:hypothetical protein